MARLRLGSVEYKVCATKDCEGLMYEGAQCPECKDLFGPETVQRAMYDRLILVDVDPPVYERDQRCRCTHCGNLYALSEHDIMTNAICDRCKKPLFSPEQLRKIWKNAQTHLQRARGVHQARRKLASCPNCGEEVRPVCWCPLCHSRPRPLLSDCLPQRPTVVWVRTFHSAESYDELRDHKLRQAAKEDATEMETEEGNDDGEEHHE